jgi:hypothetical protein
VALQRASTCRAQWMEKMEGETSPQRLRCTEVAEDELRKFGHRRRHNEGDAHLDHLCTQHAANGICDKRSRRQ